jgi:UTP:GlnB (protein PII) uridylyltransferase
MPNRQLTPDELERAKALLAEIRSKLEALSKGDKELLFAYRRKIFKELTYDERSKPMVRRILKDQKWKEQRGLCAICGKELPEKYTVLDRLNAADGYTKENTRLVHQQCDVEHQASKGYT